MEGAVSRRVYPNVGKASTTSEFNQEQVFYNALNDVVVSGIEGASSSESVTCPALLLRLYANV